MSSGAENGLIERLSVVKFAGSFALTHPPSPTQFSLYRVLAPGVFPKENTGALFIEIAWLGKNEVF